jgi:RNA polymerase sigma-70 factor (ECF subfamily)
MASAGDDRQGEAGRIAAAESEKFHAFGQGLERFRSYLLMIAGREMNAELRAKCGASDLVQQAFYEAVRDRDALMGRSPRQVRGWLRGILINTTRDVARSYAQAKRNTALEVSIERGNHHGLVDPDLTPGAQAVAREEASSLNRALARLPEDYRRVIELRNRECRPFGEIADMLGRSTDAVRMLWFRAVERLQKELAAADEA